MLDKRKHLVVNVRDHMQNSLYQTEVDPTSIDGDIYTRVFLKRNTDATLAIKSELSAKVDGQYTVKTYTYYAANGIDVIGTQVRNLIHHENGTVTEVNV